MPCAEGGKSQGPFVAALAKGPPRKEHNSLVLQIELPTETGWQSARALLDSGAEQNLVSQILVKERGWEPVGPPISMHDINGRSFHCYGVHQLSIRVRDACGKTREARQMFYAVDSDEYKVVLGYPWLEYFDPEIAWKARCFRYRIDEDDLELQEPREFQKTAIESGRMYAICVSGVGNPASVKCPTIAAVRIADPTAEPKLPVEFTEYADVFDTEKAGVLAAHSKNEHAINLDGNEPPFGPLYNLSAKELEILRTYLNAALAKGWIRRSTSPAGAPVLFAPKKDGSLRLCVDYRGLNKITIKDRCPLPLISETLDRLVGAAYYTKLDLKDAYHRIRIKAGDEWKTAFRTRYGHFEYLVMPFGLANAPATFQAYINQALQGYLDTICVVYLDDILIYSTSYEQHIVDVRMVLERLRKWQLYANPLKCTFFAKEVEFLGYIIGTTGISMDPRRVTAIDEWEAPTTFRELQVFLGFANFYRRFIAGYSRITAPLSDLLKGSKDGKKPGPFDFPEKAKSAFQTLKQAFTSAPMLLHYDPAKPTQLETDASGFALAGVITQQQEAGGLWHPVAFWSRKMLPAEMNYETHDQELLAIVEIFRIWRHYLLGVHVTVIVLTDHNNLKYFMTTKALNPRQARWAETLAQFDFEIRYRTGKSNPADGPSRRPDYKPSDDERATVAVPTLRSKLQAISPELAEINAVDLASRQDASRSSWGNPVIASVVCAIDARPERQADCSQGVALEEASPPSSRHFRDLREVPPDEMSVVEGETPLDSAGCDEARMLNPVADAIGCKQCVSRIAVAAATRGRTVYDLPGEALLELILKAQQADEFVRNKEYKASPSKRKKATGRPEGSEDSPVWGAEWRVDQSGLLRRHNSVFVPASPALRNEILEMVHDDPLSGHFGVKKTLELLARSWWWPGMKQSVQEYVETCPICQRTKVKRHRPYGALQSLPQPSGKWKEITMDFVTDLPPSRNGEGKVFDSLFVVVDRYTKLAKYIPVLKSITAEQLANVFLERIVSQFGTPEGIVSDRGTVFTSTFWSQLCYCLRIRRKLSTAFHPQTDGQTERQNQSLEHYFRCYCNYLQDDWVTKSPLAEFAYNNSVHSTTGMSPFFAMYGFHPNVPSSVRDDRPEGEVPAARKKAEEFENEGKELAERWRRAVEFQKKWYDKKHTPMHFSIGDWVMLASTNLRQQRPNKKLSDRYLGPFKVTGVIGEQAYELELPEKWTIHPVFHVSLLEPYRRRPGEDPASHPEAVLVDGDEEWYEVEEILDDRWRRGRAEYLVRWTGYAPAYNQWVTEADLEHAGGLLPEYKLKMENRPHNARHTKYRRRK
jgi:hypothetical protein